jgi:hypothetical protein
MKTNVDREEQEDCTGPRKLNSPPFLMKDSRFRLEAMI